MVVGYRDEAPFLGYVIKLFRIDFIPYADLFQDIPGKIRSAGRTVFLVDAVYLFEFQGPIGRFGNQPARKSLDSNDFLKVIDLQNRGFSITHQHKDSNFYLNCLSLSPRCSTWVKSYPLS